VSGSASGPCVAATFTDFTEVFEAAFAAGFVREPGFDAFACDAGAAPFVRADLGFLVGILGRTVPTIE
jgi:hypothetical protein